MGSAAGQLDAGTLVRSWPRIVAAVVGKGFSLRYEKLEPPRLGIFNGLQITIDPAAELEMQCFLVLHLFGHSVQWVAPSYQPEIEGLSVGDLEVYLAAVKRYERNAARFGLQLLREAGIMDLDDWLVDFTETDWKYVETFYRTGKLPRWESCVVRGCTPLEPLVIPPLEPRLVEVMYAF
jgi:hypothetical protein